MTEKDDQKTLELMSILLVDKVWNKDLPQTQLLKIIIEKISKIKAETNKTIEKLFLDTFMRETQVSVIRESCKSFVISMVEQEISSIRSFVKTRKSEEFLDPISKKIMKEPVTLQETGVVVDKESLDRYLLTNNTCPVKKIKLKNFKYNSCESLKRSILSFKNKFIDYVLRIGMIGSRVLSLIYNSSNENDKGNYGKMRKDLWEFLNQAEDYVSDTKEKNTMGKKSDLLLQILQIKERIYSFEKKNKKVFLVRFRIAEILEKNGDLTKANRLLNSGIKLCKKPLIDKNDKEYFQLYERLLKKIYTNFLLIEEKNVHLKRTESLLELCRHYKEFNHPKRAINLIEEFLQKNPTNLRVLKFLITLQEEGSKKQAQSYFNLGDIMIKMKNQDVKKICKAYVKGFKITKPLEIIESFVSFCEKRKLNPSKFFDMKQAAKETQDIKKREIILNLHLKHNKKDKEAQAMLGDILQRKHPHSLNSPKIENSQKNTKKFRKDENSFSHSNMNMNVLDFGGEYKELGLTEKGDFNFDDIGDNTILVKEIKSLRKRVFTLERLLKKSVEESNRKMKILYTQYKDVREHFMNSKEDIDQIKTFMKLTCSTWVDIKNPQLGHTTKSDTFSMSGLRFQTEIKVSLNGVITVIVNLLDKNLLGKGIIVCSFQDDTKKQKMDLKKGVVTFTDFNYFTNKIWSFKFSMVELKMNSKK